jgi:uncharacterized membrane protein
MAHASTILAMLANASTSRVEALSDAVFAIAMTLLVIDLKVPPIDADLLHALAERGAAIGAYIVSFVAISGYWLQHHRLFHMLARSDGWLLLLNLVLLLAITFMPYPTAVLADRLVSAQQVNLAVAFYGIGQLLPALAMCVLFQYCRSAGLIAPALGENLLRRLTWMSWGSAFAYFVSIGLALVAPVFSLIYYALAPLYWAIDGARARHELPNPHKVKRE